MQGNCNAESEFGSVPPKHAPLRDFQPEQCLLVADHNVLEVWDSKLWLEGFYFRLAEPRLGTFDQFVLVTGSIAELWMTHVTMQGNGNDVQDCIDCGVAVRGEGSVYGGGALTVHTFSYYMCGLCCVTTCTCSKLLLVIQCCRYDVVSTAPLLGEAVQHSCDVAQYLDPRKRAHSSPNKYCNNMLIAARITGTPNTSEHKDILTALITRAFQALPASDGCMAHLFCGRF